MTKASLHPDAAFVLERQAFEQAGVGLAYMKGDRFVRVNHAFSALVGVSVAELEGATFFEFAHPDDRLDIPVKFAALMAENKPLQTFDERFVRKDRSEAWVISPSSRSTRSRPTT